MKFGLRYCNTGPFVDPKRAVELLQAAEEAGFDSAWTVEHTVVPAGYASAYPYSEDGKMAGGRLDIPLPDPIVWMSYVAAHTERIRLATGILILPQHNPVIVAKQVATLDAMSNGRVILGIGVGWLREEFEAIGTDFESRAARTDEYIEAMRALWRQDAPSYKGKFVQFDGAYCRPQPVRGSVPIVIGGHSRAAARRAGRLGDGFFPARGLKAELLDLVKQTAEASGRDPAGVEITASLPEDLDDLPKLAALGVSRIVVPVTPVTGLKAPVSGPEDALAWRGRIESFRET